MRNTATDLKVGDTIDYELWEANEYGVHRITEKSNKPMKQGFAKDYIKDSITMCMSYTKDLIVAGKVDMKDMEKEADRIYKRVLTKLI